MTSLVCGGVIMVERAESHTGTRLFLLLNKMLVVSVVIPISDQHWHLRVHSLDAFADCAAELNAVIIREDHNHHESWIWILWKPLFVVLGLWLQGKCRFTTCNLF